MGCHAFVFGRFKAVPHYMGEKKASAKWSVKGDFNLEQVGFFEVVIKLVDV